MITWLLKGRKEALPFAVSSKSPIEKSNGNSSDEQTDRELAKLLTVNGVVRAASADRGNDPTGNSHFRSTDGKVYTIHIYADETETNTTGIYLPNFSSPPRFDGRDTVIAATREGYGERFFIPDNQNTRPVHL